MITPIMRGVRNMTGACAAVALPAAPGARTSSFFMQISTEAARQGVPVVYYDFENGRVLTRLYTRAGWTDLLPSWAWLQAGLEGSLGSSGSDARGTVGAYAGLPWLMAGVDLQLPSQHPIFGLQLHVPLRRAGLMRRGDLLRGGAVDRRWILVEQGGVPEPADQERQERQQRQEVDAALLGRQGEDREECQQPGIQVGVLRVPAPAAPRQAV